MSALGSHVELVGIPTRIVSLVPSQTELLYDLGLADEVVGITKFCIHPAHWFRSKKRVGGTKKVNRSVIDDLKPDLILANKEENVREQIEDLARDYPVWVSDILDLKDAIQMIETVGALCGRQSRGKEIADAVTQSFLQEPLPRSPKRVLYLIWYQPWMAAGCDTFIHSMMEAAGFPSCLSVSRYPVLKEEEIIALQPDIIFLSSEPFPFREKHMASLQRLLPNAMIELVDGELFSWYGSRLLRSFDYFRSLNEKLA